MLGKYFGGIMTGFGDEVRAKMSGMESKFLA